MKPGFFYFIYLFFINWWEGGISS